MSSLCLICFAGKQGKYAPKVFIVCLYLFSRLYEHGATKNFLSLFLFSFLCHCLSDQCSQNWGRIHASELWFDSLCAICWLYTLEFKLYALVLRIVELHCHSFSILSVMFQATGIAYHLCVNLWCLYLLLFFHISFRWKYGLSSLLSFNFFYHLILLMMFKCILFLVMN